MKKILESTIQQEGSDPMKNQHLHPDPALRQEILLQVNQRLFDGGYITKNLYNEAKIRIVSP